MSIYKKLLEAKKEIGTVAKNAKNPHFKNTYADINALISAVEPILLGKGLLLLQPIVDGKQYSVIYDVETSEKVESYIELNSSLAPQPLGSAITYFRRYTLQSLLSLQADDDDGQKASAPTPKQPFTKANFEAAKKVGATLEMIINKYTITDAVRKEWEEFNK